MSGMTIVIVDVLLCTYVTILLVKIHQKTSPLVFFVQAITQKNENS